MSYRLDNNDRVFEYHMTIASYDPANAAHVAQHLRNRKDVLEFRISPAGD
jgi:hypothetical protein